MFLSVSEDLLMQPNFLINKNFHYEKFHSDFLENATKFINAANGPPYSCFQPLIDR